MPYRLAAAGWTVLILILSIIPFSGTEVVSFTLSDKIVHACFYMVLGFLWYMALKSSKVPYKLLKIALFSFLYGIIIEVLQHTMPFNRHFELYDIVANGTGIGISVIFIKIHLLVSGIALKRKK